MTIDKIPLSEWKSKYMQNMYLESFGGERNDLIEKCDFVLIARNENIQPVAFITCHEMDTETIYWQFGGACDNIKKSIRVMSHYVHFLVWCMARYKRVTTRIENTNTAMLKMAIHCGFVVYGIWNFKNKIYLELCYEAGGA